MSPTERPTLPQGGENDIDILREMYPTRGVSISGIDPRLNAGQVARRLGISRARVAGRLKAWTEFGFLERYDVWPNPFLFGLTGLTFDVKVRDRFQKPDLFERIALMHGAVGALDFAGDWIGATFVLPADEDPARTAGVLRGLAGVSAVEGVRPWTTSKAPRPLTPLELRIVRVLRQYPTDSLGEVARHVGVSTRTITSRYRKLLDDHAVWFVPILDFRALVEPVVSVTIEFRTPADREGFARQLHQTYPRSIEFHRAPFGPALPDTLGSYFVVARSAARVEEFETWVAHSPGVTGQEAFVLVRIVSFPETFDRLLRDAAGDRVRNRSGRR